MGNHRFRLSDMMPNAWFYKLRDMSSSSSRGGGGGVMRGQSITPHYSLKHRSQQPPKPSSSSPSPTTPNPFLPNRPSYYFSSRAAENTTTNLPSSPIHPKASDTHFPLVDPPRKSHRKPTPKPPVRPSIKQITSIPNPRNNNDDDDDEKEEERTQLESDAAAQLQLPPILTKPALKEEKPPRMDDKIMISSRSPARRSPPGIHRFRLRASSPRLANKRIQAHRARRSTHQRRGVLPESFAVVKKSSDPQRDFRESMVEMIVENNIRASKDLEELLACYLSLNSNEYHGLIIKVFEQIWFDLTDIRL